MIDLNSYLEPYSLWGANYGDYLYNATGINNFGEVVGYGLHTGFARMFVMRHQTPHPSTACPCEQPTISRPAPQTVSSQWNDGKDWSMKVEVSDNDGLVLRDVKLGRRYMAQEISVPYFTLKTTGFSDAQGNPVRGELKPAGDDAAARSRLIDFQVSQPGSNPLVIKATYGIDKISSTGADSCLSITERYEFYKEVTDCEPSQYVDDAVLQPYILPSLKASPFKPIIEYAFHSDGAQGADGDKLISVNIPQRLSFQDEGFPENTGTFFRDAEDISEVIKNGFTIVDKKLTPLTEISFWAVQNGERSPQSLDNFHQTYSEEVDSPTTVPPGPGCPECVHIHWRWSSLSKKPTDPSYYGGGKPRIPSGSNQDVEIALVKNITGEEHPNDFHDLLTGDIISGDVLNQQPLVFWYSGTGHQDHDRFFTHGGFFSADGDVTASGPPETPMSTADLQVTQDPLPSTPISVGDTVDLVYHIKNLGPDAATAFQIFDELPKGLDYVEVTGDIDHLPFYSYNEQLRLVDGIGIVLNAGDRMAVRIKVRATNSGQFANTLRVEASNKFDDPDSSNNQTTQTITIQ